ncbi:hypothetical protein DFH09DRAFT_1098529 [Mycena vulgaris]|nr:hypothetical protein DFH09DRAFT_1098529 [Mycena vulgaris]
MPKESGEKMKGRSRKMRNSDPFCKFIPIGLNSASALVCPMWKQPHWPLRARSVNMPDRLALKSWPRCSVLFKISQVNSQGLSAAVKYNRGSQSERFSADSGSIQTLIQRSDVTRDSKDRFSDRFWVDSFFGARPARPLPPARPGQSSSAIAGPSSAVARPSSLAVSTTGIIDADADDSGMDSDIVLPQMDLDPHGILLHHLRVVISTLLSSIPSASGLLASFAADPVALVGPGQDAWEDVIHGMFNGLFYEGARCRNGIDGSAMMLVMKMREGALAKGVK